ncbi:hypothetical protein DEIPH_ctg011orf0136 [Deinococcus phoenicis]|uniref:Uncharacterized protein n=1 Tax=Deinococcus phoenicis TaxID=1476583 RepID=A0A016QTE9_9DEIO|nr:hypothetical protein DEIPH_ctg011orf0136 [Deinococcus phoenicis]
MGQRVLLACTGDLTALRPALEECRAAWPDAHFTLLIPAGEGGHLPGWAASVMAPGTFWTPDLLDRLRAGRFDAALILTAPGDSPHGLGYLCALAGIPVRAGVSGEFGGQTLTRWLKPARSGPGTPDPASTLLTGLFSTASCSSPERS